MRQLRIPHLIATLLLTFFVVSVPVQASDLKQHLRDQYRGKSLLLRGFYTGNKLQYDATGAPVGGAMAGDWTTDGVVFLNDVHVSGSRLIIKARRLVVSSSHRTLLAGPPKNQKETSLLRIEAELGSRNPSPEQADAAMSMIFLTQHDDFAVLVPDYWKPCVRSALIGKDPDCHFSPEFLAIPGAASSDRNTSPSKSASAAPSTRLTGPLFHIGGGVSPPRQTYSPEPSFSEPARKAKYQGTVVITLIVNEEGLPTNIHITAPLGYGLDDKAVQAVQTWKFKPAQKDGRPVATQIAVEVDFHLY
jgi:TonB family protein